MAKRQTLPQGAGALPHFIRSRSTTLVPICPSVHPSFLQLPGLLSTSTPSFSHARILFFPYKHTKQPPTTGPLHVLFLLLGMLSLQTSQSLPPLSHPVCVKCHLLQENLNQPSLLHPSLCLPCFVLLHSSCHWIYFIFISLFIKSSPFPGEKGQTSKVP